MGTDEGLGLFQRSHEAVGLRGRWAATSDPAALPRPLSQLWVNLDARAQFEEEYTCQGVI